MKNNQLFPFFFLIFFSINSCSTKRATNYSLKVTPHNILRLKIGMNKSKVIQIIGLPIIPSDTIRKEWTLTKEVKGVHPMIWLGFDDKENLERIMITYYDSLDDYSIYGLVKEFDGLKHWGCNNEQELSKFFI